MGPSRTASPHVAPALLVLLVVTATLALSTCGNQGTAGHTSASPLSTAATAPSPSTTSPATTTGPGTIAFVRVSGNARDIYSIRTDGTGLRQLTDTPGDEAYPGWSPDGKRIGFVRWLGKTVGCHASADVKDFPLATAWVMNADGSHQHRLSPPQLKGVFGPCWSPDGRRVLFAKWEGDYLWTMVVMNIDGSGLRQLTDVPTARVFMNWSPDGRIFYNEGPGTLYAMNPDGSGLKAIAVVPDLYSISPDGKWLAITEDSTGQILLAPADGPGAQEPLIEDVSPYVPDGIVATSWSPDGSAIAFAADWNGKGPSALYILTTDGSVTKVPNTGQVFDPAWRPQ
jgi:Tol biopolymer transport system component